MLNSVESSFPAVFFSPRKSYHPILRYSQLFLLISTAVSAVLGDVSWWSTLAQLSTSNLLAGSTLNRPPCLELKGLSPGQATICELFKDHIPAVGQGAKTAINECEYQFRDQLWNCSTPQGSGLIGPVHKFGVAHEIGRRCRLGQLKSCGCSEAPRPASVNQEWTWGGCGDNVEYGYRFARDFIDVREKEESFKRSESLGRSLMNRWNNEVGRRILKRHTKPKCKCHGVSGSCNLKTCWMQLPPMREIGNLLQTKYRAARRIQINSRGNMQFESMPNSRPMARRKNRSLTDLVYLEESPDYCNHDRANGTLGTQGRICSKDPKAINSCNKLCCGRGYDSYTEEIVTKCDCKFQWCCQVICRTCRNTTQIHICK